MNIQAVDRQNIWHPFTQHGLSAPITPIMKGKGAYLYDENSRPLLDLTSSWWVNVHGHGHPVIAKAIYEQALQLEHVIFSGFTHEPAVRLSEQLLERLPAGFSKVFFSDNGSTAVEVAMKMAYQYWQNVGEHKKKQFLAFEGGYHGDTIGAMSAGQSSGFYEPFKALMFPVDFIPYPFTWDEDLDTEAKEQQSLKALNDLLEQKQGQFAAIILEPLLQGAAGMRIARPAFLDQLISLCRAHGILVIFDEIFTGFGRAGTMFAMQQLQSTPDIVCLSKGLTGGFLPLAVTVAQEKIFEAFLSQEFNKAFIHGHSYTANPLGCAAACASLALFQTENTLQKVQAIHRQHKSELQKLKEKFSQLKAPRVCGPVAAFNLDSEAVNYFNPVSKPLIAACFEQGLLMRPIGNCIYLMPPFCIEPDDLANAYNTLGRCLESVYQLR